MAKVWFNKKKKLYCADIKIDGCRRRIFVTSRKRDSEILLRKILSDKQEPHHSHSNNQVSILVSKTDEIMTPPTPKFPISSPSPPPTPYPYSHPTISATWQYTHHNTDRSFFLMRWSQASERSYLHPSITSAKGPSD